MEIKKRYVVRFKRKPMRVNQRDDKITLLKRAINMDPTKITRRDERVMAVHEVGDNTTALAQDPEKIVDINEFSVPLTIVSLSPDQVLDLKKDKNVEVVYEDVPAGIRMLETVDAQILPYAPPDDARSKEYVTENVKRIKAHNAWTYKTGYGVRVAVMDSGIDKTHPDLAKNFKGGSAFISGDNSPPGTRNDSVNGGHGSGCAGIIGATRGNNQGVVGIAPDCFLYDVRVFAINGSSAISVGQLVTAFTWCGDNAIDVCSMSFGADYGFRYNETDDWPSWMNDMQAAIKAAYTKGTMFIAASGNENNDRSNKTKIADVTYPAAFDFVASVGAIMPDDSVADFSNTGDTIDLVGPGESNRKDPPYGLTTYAGGIQTGQKFRDAYGWFNGTSMACPHVAGVMALGQSAYKPESCVVAYNGLGTVRPRANVIARTVAFTADGLGSPPMNSNDQETGFGLPNAERAVRILLNINDEGNQVGSWPASLQQTAINTRINGLFS